MSWRHLVLSCWPALAIPAALLVGRGIDLAERRAKESRRAELEELPNED